jgi:hypothetical protein
MVGEGRRLATELVVINASATQEMYTRAAGAAAGSLAVGPSAVGSIALTMPPPVGVSTLMICGQKKLILIPFR